MQKCVCPVCLGDLQSDDAHTFLFLVGKVGTIPIVEGPACSTCERRCSWTSKPTVTLFRNGLGVDVKADHHEQNIRDLGKHTVERRLRQPKFPDMR